MQPCPSTNFEIQKYYQNNAQLSSKDEPKFDGNYSRSNLPKTRNGTYVTNLDEFKSVGPRWIALYLKIFQKKWKYSKGTKI